MEQPERLQLKKFTYVEKTETGFRFWGEPRIRTMHLKPEQAEQLAEFITGIDKKKLYRLIMNMVGGSVAQMYLSMMEDGQGADKQAEKSRAAKDTIKEMLGIPEYHFNGEVCKCGAYLWWDGTCTECES